MKHFMTSCVLYAPCAERGEEKKQYVIFDFGLHGIARKGEKCKIERKDKCFESVCFL